MPFSKTDLAELSIRFGTKEACLEFLERLRFPNGLKCPRCGNTSISRIRTVYKLQCMGCRYMFSITAGTIFHRSHIPLKKWILAAFLICNAKKGISAKQIQRDLKVTYKTAWYLMHRIRRAMRDRYFLERFTGIAEVDETYVGGRRTGKRGRGAADKIIVLGIKQRGGQIRAEVADNMKGKNLSRIVRKYVNPKTATIYVDELNAYNQLALEYRLKRINHQIQYVRGKIHTNGIENFWSILKRGIVGVYHTVSVKYMPLYLNEFTFRFNRNGRPDVYLSVLENCLVHDSALRG